MNLPHSLLETLAPACSGFSQTEEQDSEEKQILDKIIGPGERTNIFNNITFSIYVVFFFKEFRTYKIIKSPSLLILDFLTC